MRRYNWHRAGSLGCPFPMQKFKYIFQAKNIRKQFYQTTLGNCYSLKLPKWRLLFEKNRFSVLFVIIFGTLSFPFACILYYTQRCSLKMYSIVIIHNICTDRIVANRCVVSRYCAGVGWKPGMKSRGRTAAVGPGLQLAHQMPASYPASAT